MESVAYIENNRKKTSHHSNGHKDMQQVHFTPMSKLHTVDEFIDRLEQAVLDRL